jgi:hypothetical protein
MKGLKCGITLNYLKCYTNTTVWKELNIITDNKLVVFLTSLHCAFVLHTHNEDASTQDSQHESF